MITRESQLLVESTAAAFARGELVVVADDDDRENEGDLFVAASMCTPEKMAFVIRHTSGIVCAPLSVEEAKRLHLDPMVALNDAPLGTAFTVTVDVRHGLTTGISAEERSNTVRGLAELMNDDGTVLRGMGVTEFARRHGLQCVSIADLIAYRQARDKLVKRVAEFQFESEIGTLAGYSYVTPFDQVHHMAFVYGRIGDGKNMLA